MYKYFSFFIVTIFGVFLITSCSKSNKEELVQPSAHDQFVSSLSKEDTTTVLNLCQEFFANLSANDKDAAIGMLSLSNDSGLILPMSEEKSQNLKKQFTLFPVLDNHLIDYTFGESTDNLVRFKIVFAKDEQGKEEAINFGLNPVRKDGKWYLTVRNASAQVAQ